jgi:hemolysin D
LEVRPVCTQLKLGVNETECSPPALPISNAQARPVVTAENRCIEPYDVSSRQQLAFKAAIELADQSLRNGDLTLPLAAGMRVSAEIIVGKRTILEYLLSPVQRITSEAGTER